MENEPSDGRAAIPWRLAQAEKWIEFRGEALLRRMDAAEARLREFDTLDPIKLKGLSDAADADSQDRVELTKVVRNALITLFASGLMGPIMVLIAIKWWHL